MNALMARGLRLADNSQGLLETLSPIGRVILSALLALLGAALLMIAQKIKQKNQRANKGKKKKKDPFDGESGIVITLQAIGFFLCLVGGVNFLVNLL